MKSKLYNSRLLRYFRRLVHGKNPGNMSPTEKRKVVVETDLRWEDDGGPVVEVVNPINQAAEKDVAEKDVAGSKVL